MSTASQTQDGPTPTDLGRPDRYRRLLKTTEPTTAKRHAADNASSLSEVAEERHSLDGWLDRGAEESAPRNPPSADQTDLFD